MMQNDHIAEALKRFAMRNSVNDISLKAALIDMDGVLYDSMKYHTLAWQHIMTELGVECTREEFYLYEGMTGRDTINLLMRRSFGHEATAEEAAELYRRKTEYFRQCGAREPMPGADIMLSRLRDAGLRRVLVTGSGQKSLISTLNHDYPGMFADDMRVTAADVIKGKPDPEPYLAGLRKACVKATEAIVIENAPLGVKSGHNAGCLVAAVTTGPVPAEEMWKAGADMVFESMPAFADALPRLLTLAVHDE